ncbi:MAG: DUF4443 domain-containing protein [Candidatus Woesearchaeota archaeon]
MVGNPKKFDSVDVLRALMFIDSDVSRTAVVEALGIGEGSARAVLDILKEKGLIASTRQGHSLTKKGLSVRQKIMSFVQYRQCFPDFFLGFQKCAVLIRPGEKVRPGYFQRDAAIKNGAEAAMLLVYDTGLRMMESDDFDCTPMESLFSFRKDDILLITVAKSRYLAERSGIAVCIEMLPGLRTILEKNL